MTTKSFAWRLCGIIGALTACLFGSVTYAMFTDEAPVRGVVVAGDFDISLGALTWDSPTQGNSGSGADSLASVSLGGGDQLIVDQQIDATFVGDNLNVVMTVTWAGLPSGAVTGWSIADADHQQVLPDSGAAAMGEQLSPSGLVSSGSTTWHLIITVTMPDSLGVYADPASPPQDDELPLGIITVTANQVRG